MPPPVRLAEDDAVEVETVEVEAVELEVVEVEALELEVVEGELPPWLASGTADARPRANIKTVVLT
jgi:hypothetical protein